MNQYSRWKYFLILLTLGLSLIYVTPNFYGESYAIQVMPLKSGETIDSKVLKVVESKLNQEDLNNKGLINEQSIRARHTHRLQCAPNT